MSVAAYASLVSLTHVLENIHYRAQLHHVHVDIKRIEASQEIVNFFLEFVEVHSPKEGRKIDDLWRQISKVAFEAEEIIDLHVVNQLQVRFTGVKVDSGCSKFNQDIDGVIRKLDLIKNELLVVDVGFGKQSKVSEDGGNSMTVSGGTSLKTKSGGKTTIVGLDEQVVAIMDMLTRGQPELQIIPIVGMGGIGKTTLAKAVFDNQYIVEHFDRRIWCTISQVYDVQDILLSLLKDLKVGAPDDDKIGETSHKELFCHRYLIVMDDVWSMQAWDDLRRFFPDNCNRSRILITTRLSQMAGSLGCPNPYSMTFLNANESWNLFCRTVFGKEYCPYPELEESGRNIVKRCKGLPLEIIVIGGLLSKSDMSREYWEYVAENVSSFGNSGYDEHCLKILSLSYKNLPIHLKPCFLFLGSYPEDRKIGVTDLTQRWIANGLIRTVGEKSLEDIAMEFIKDLIARNLFFIHELTSSGEIDVCGIHDLLRDFCHKEFDKERLMLCPRVQVVKYTRGSSCFLCGEALRYRNERDVAKVVLLYPSLSSPVRSPSVCGACRRIYSQVTKERFVGIICEDYENLALLHHTQVRLISLYSYARVRHVLPGSHFLWDLQTLKIDVYDGSRATYLPSEIWEMPQLRHIYVGDGILPDPVATHVDGEGAIILKQLQTLSVIHYFKCTDNVLDRIPDLKTLQITYDSEFDESIALPGHSLCNLVQLQKLQSLKITHALENIAFPTSLKDLSLKGCRCRIPWSELSIIGSLPNLEKLELIDSTEGFEWNPVDGEFLRLKELTIASTNLVQWVADQIHFPTLEKLHLYYLYSLEEIPLGIGDIPTLRAISLVKCSESTIDSAWQIWKEQESVENDTLEICISHYERWYSIKDFMAPRWKNDESEDEEDDDSKSRSENEVDKPKNIGKMKLMSLEMIHRLIYGGRRIMQLWFPLCVSSAVFIAVLSFVALKFM
ncbi:putative late blight resistance protein homolog R1A-10 isoform X2 [Andrographis paniculata]|uniref:putative late blight resistance protein homolog R1A-10 isoform X2 n=1 Tax=Andrographis paniculata TaxID=175694 RepID=UPI0021E7E961|nr:putative late blight resistance protein homolog R1A-10 isoform X2 [Andrographis paniculata]